MRTYLPAALIGLAAAFLMVPMATVLGTGGLWTHPGTDLAQNLGGHLAAQIAHPFWRPLFATDLAWPHGINVAMTDSNPLLTLLAELLDAILGRRDVNLMGAWFFACWLLQPIAAVYAVRGFAPNARVEARVAAALLALTYPALLARYVHVNLVAHFLLLLALGLSARMLRQPGRSWWACFWLMLVTILVHPYLFVFGGIALFAPVIARGMEAPRGRRLGATARAFGLWVLATGLPVVAYELLSGGSGGADIGWGHYSMNLLSPLWPAHSGLFGPHRPDLDATGGQYEGFNYLGAGGWLLILAALTTGWWRRWRAWLPLILVLAGLTLIALSTVVYAGHVLILSLGIRPWDQVFGIVRASGRAFWIVGYAILLGAVAHLSLRLRRSELIPLLVVALGLQLADAAPLWRDAHHYYAHGIVETASVPVLPARMTLLRTAPVCIPPGPVAFISDRMRLAAIERGAATADVHASRLPRWFSCEAAASDALETPLLPGEVRVFIDPITAELRQEALGPGANCRRQDEAVVCAAGEVPHGEPVPRGAPLPVVTVPAALAGQALAPVLATGWKLDHGTAWSEGPRASLLFRLAGAEGPVRVTLALDGIAPAAGGTRNVVVRVGYEGEERRVALKDAVLKDGIPATLTLDVPDPTQPVWIAFTIYRPLDPAKRHLTVPVHRAALRLHAITVEPGS